MKKNIKTWLPHYILIHLTFYLNVAKPGFILNQKMMKRGCIPFELYSSGLNYIILKVLEFQFTWFHSF